MTSALVQTPNMAAKLRRGDASPLLVGGTALLLRLYQLGRQPFWFDELYLYQISLQSPGVIIRQAWFEPWPSLYYFFAKVTSGFGLVHAEWAWRWSSVAAGTLAVLVLYFLLCRVAGAGPATLASLLVALSPMQLYFSQEARPYMLAMLTVVASTVVVWRISTLSGGRAAGRERTNWWLAWFIVTILGLYQAYAYAVVWLLQAAYLLWLERGHRRAVVVVAGTMLAFLPPLYLIGVNVGGTLARGTSTAPLTLPFLARMALGGDPNRYGNNWGQTVLALVLGGLAGIGLLWALRRRPVNFEHYLALQVVLPLVGFFATISGPLGIHIPSFQARQFIVLLPAFYGLVALGWQALLQPRLGWPGRAIALALWGAALVACLPGLARYWTLTKSPEGDLALALRQETNPGDAVVSLHYSLDAALSFYTPAGVRVFTKPVAQASGYAFSSSLSILYGVPIATPYHLADIRGSPRVWVLARQGYATDIVTALSQGCSSPVMQSFPPFVILRLDNCSAP